MFQLAAAGVLALATLISFGADAGATPRLPAVRVHADGHYLETEDGQPFLWMGDTAWGLIYGTTREECTYYLNTRAKQGFNLVQTVLLRSPNRLHAATPDAERPFVDEDPTRPNDAYFQRMLEVVDEAASLGMYVALLPTWGDRVTAPWGRGPRSFRLDNLPVARSYGRYLGAKLKDRTNVIWVLGGDRPSKLDPNKSNEWPQTEAMQAGFPADQDWRPIWREMAAGIADGTGGKPVCLYHPEGGKTTSPNLHHEAWLSMNGLQSGHGEGLDFPVWDWVARDFALTPAKPTIDLEPNYEDHPVNPWPRWDPSLGYFRDHDVRKQCYRSVIAGACGVTYGHHAVFGFAGVRNNANNHADRDWINAMHRPGGRQMGILRDLIESRPFFSRIPDQPMVDNPNTARALHITACRDREGTYAFVYFPERDQSATIDLGKLRPGKLRAWWFDPRTGFAHPIGEIDGGVKREFKTPLYGPDWVLVLDSVDAHYAAPGQERFVR